MTRSSSAVGGNEPGYTCFIERRLVLVVGLMAALPILGATADALAIGWTPVFDDAIVTARAFDVLTSGSPLVGQYSDASQAGGPPVYGAGPLLFWLLALPTRLPGDWALPLTMALANTASVVGVVALARRRGGRLLMFATALAVIAMCRSLPDGALYTVVNPWCAMLPMTLLFFLAWSVACGEHALLPLTALVASFCIQTHFSLVVPTICALAVAGVGLTVSVLSRRAHWTAGHWSLRRSLLATLVVALLCWSAPLLDEALHQPGNLVQIARTTTAGEPRFGISGGWHAAVKAIGARPWWLETPKWTDALSFVEVTERPSTVAIVTSVLMIAGLSAVALQGLRLRRLDFTAGASLALLLTAAVLLVMMSTPSRLGLSVLKGVGWASPAGMFAWLVLGWSAAVLLQPAGRRAMGRIRALSPAARRAPWPALGLAVTAIAGLLVALGERADARFQWTYEPVSDVTSHLDAGISDSGPLLVSAEFAGPFNAFRFQTAIVYQLRRRGYRVVVPTPGLFAMADKLGADYSTARHPPRNAIYLDQTEHPASRPGERVLGRVALPDAPADVSPRELTISVAPVP
jgi:hypothetical protein